MALSTRRLPSLLRGPDELSSPALGGTMKALRLPIRVSTATYLVRGRSPHDPSIVRARLCAPGSSEASSGPGLCCAGCPSFRLCSRGREWDLSGLQTIHPVPLLRSRTPVEPTWPRHDGHVDAAPAIRTAKASAMADFGANPWASAPAVLRFTLPLPSRAKLASGWLACLCRAGVEPAGSLREVSARVVDHPPLLLSW